MSTSPGDGLESLAGSVLVVDDDEDIRLSLQQTLQAGLPAIEVAVAADADEALAMLEAGPVDVLITDQRMPGLSGIELMKIVRERHPGLPMIMVTGFPDVHLAQRAINEAKVLRFWVKPVQPDALIEAVAQGILLGDG